MYRTNRSRAEDKGLYYDRFLPKWNVEKLNFYLHFLMFDAYTKFEMSKCVRRHMHTLSLFFARDSLIGPISLLNSHREII